MPDPKPMEPVQHCIADRPFGGHAERPLEDETCLVAGSANHSLVGRSSFAETMQNLLLYRRFSS
jgi:hypothetical protein